MVFVLLWFEDESVVLSCTHDLKLKIKSMISSQQIEMTELFRFNRSKCDRWSRENTVGMCIESSVWSRGVCSNARSFFQEHCCGFGFLSIKLKFLFFSSNDAIEFLILVWILSGFVHLVKHLHVTYKFCRFF